MPRRPTSGWSAKRISWRPTSLRGSQSVRSVILKRMDATPQAYIARMFSFVGDDDPMTILTDTPQRLSGLVATTEAAQRTRRPEPARWSINEIVAHMADAELVLGYRLRMILASNGTQIQAFDQDMWASTFRYEACDAAESAHLLAAYRFGTLRVLGLVDKTLFDNHGMHVERGRESVRHILKFMAGHDRNHLAQIERIVVGTGA